MFRGAFVSSLVLFLFYSSRCPKKQSINLFGMCAAGLTQRIVVQFGVRGHSCPLFWQCRNMCYYSCPPCLYVREKVVYCQCIVVFLFLDTKRERAINASASLLGVFKPHGAIVIFVVIVIIVVTDGEKEQTWLPPCIILYSAPPLWSVLHLVPNIGTNMAVVTKTCLLSMWLRR